MSDRQQRADLDVSGPILRFVEDEALHGTGIGPDRFWRGLSAIIRELTPRNRELLDERTRMQRAIDAYHRARPGQPDPSHYKAFLAQIGYLAPKPADFTITTAGVDAELAAQAGPQLVVPLLNARFAVNAANARWGSLYDALYGTDAIRQDGELAPTTAYNRKRGAEVIAFGRHFLDQIAPLQDGSHGAVSAYRIGDGAIEVVLSDGSLTSMRNPRIFAGYQGSASAPSSVLLRHHGLHVDIRIDRKGTVGSVDGAGVQDIVLESAVSTIMDLEDSVAAVDAEDKALGYHNWRELVRGTLAQMVSKNGEEFLRAMNPDREYTAPDGAGLRLRGCSLLLNRNVGHHMTTDAVRDHSGAEIPEGILDAVMTTLGAMSDLIGDGEGRNSRQRALYIVKPKMHGPQEVAFSADLFARTEELLGLRDGTIKLGIMDEERRTSVNLAASLAAAADRVVFINTGFLDRTGDDIHTSLYAGPVVPRAQMRAQSFMKAYEGSNVGTALFAGFAGRAQIGKGMWAMPDLMHDMLQQKAAQLHTGATTAWVPSPTAATLHALHYHQVDVSEVQQQIASQSVPSVDQMLVLPLAEGLIDDETRLSELDDCVQSILGYVVRWVDQGIGCSKVPDIHGVALMEDRATLRISSQLLANWLTHGVVTEMEIDDALRRLAQVVDTQNAADDRYEALISENGPGIAYRAARSIIVDGASAPNGYTEPTLHRARRAKKQEAQAPLTQVRG